MAITVNLQITPTDVPAKMTNVVATYTDSEDPTNPIVISLRGVPLGSAEQRTNALDVIHDIYQAQVNKNILITAFVSDLETTGATNLEARL